MQRVFISKTLAARLCLFKIWKHTCVYYVKRSISSRCDIGNYYAPYACSVNKKVFVVLLLDNKGNPLYLKNKATKDIKQKSVKEFAVKHIAKGSTIKSDSYCRFEPALIDYIHEPVKYIPKGMILPKTSENTMPSFRFETVRQF